jgi:hypothetical protein
MPRLFFDGAVRGVGHLNQSAIGAEQTRLRPDLEPLPILQNLSCRVVSGYPGDAAAGVRR